MVAVWEYRRYDAANSEQAGLFQDMRLQSVDNPVVREVIDYAAQVAAALEIAQGPTHMEATLHCICFFSLNVD